MMRDMKINALPAYTYNWLKMNEAKVEVPAVSSALAVNAEVPAGVQASSAAIPEDVRAIKSGAGSDVDALLADAGTSMQHYLFSGKTDDALRLSYDCTGGGGASVFLELAEGAEALVVMDYQQEESDDGFACIQTKIRAGKAAHLKLIQVQRSSAGATLVNDIGGVCDDGAKIELYRLLLGGGERFDGCRIELAGDESSFEADVAYQLRGRERLDMNYDVKHLGKRTESRMDVAGVLREEAYKLFRGTIDFIAGCSTSVGNEQEDVLLLDDTVINKTIPLILCAEEDVVGNHGATIGRLDEALIFYMETRGMQREELYEMMAKARIDALIRKLPDAKMREALSDTEETE